MSAADSSRHRRLSCGTVIVTGSRELLLCHVTGQRHWDLPKGGIHDGESPLEAALRETREETGLVIDPAAVLDLGQREYTGKKDLHLFALASPRIDPAQLHCVTCFVERGSGRERPEMDGFGWFAFDRIGELCTPKLAAVLEALDLESLVRRLVGVPAEPLAA